MRHLLILRHAKAVGHEGSDHTRPLSSRGETDAQRVGAHLVAEGMAPDLILTSDARRTVQTARLVVGAAGLSEDAVRLDPSLYLADIPALLKALRSAPAHIASLLLVGHNPGLHLLAEGLGADDLTSFPTAAIAQFVVTSQSWRDLGPETCCYVGTITAR